ncbi:unnamed protein product, partial [Durusdinium trenchii]
MERPATRQYDKALMKVFCQLVNPKVDLWTPMSREEFVKSVSKLKLGEEGAKAVFKLSARSEGHAPMGEILLRALGGFGRKYRKLRGLLGLAVEGSSRGSSKASVAPEHAEEVKEDVKALEIGLAIGNPTELENASDDLKQRAKAKLSKAVRMIGLTFNLSKEAKEAKEKSEQVPTELSVGEDGDAPQRSQTQGGRRRSSLSLQSLRRSSTVGAFAQSKGLASLLVGGAPSSGGGDGTSDAEDESSPQSADWQRSKSMKSQPTMTKVNLDAPIDRGSPRRRSSLTSAASAVLAASPRRSLRRMSTGRRTSLTFGLEDEPEAPTEETYDFLEPVWQSRTAREGSGADSDVRRAEREPVEEMDRLKQFSEIEARAWRARMQLFDKDTLQFSMALEALQQSCMALQKSFKGRWTRAFEYLAGEEKTLTAVNLQEALASATEKEVPLWQVDGMTQVLLSVEGKETLSSADFLRATHFLQPCQSLLQLRARLVARFGSLEAALEALEAHLHPLEVFSVDQVEALFLACGVLPS